ncbi:hypothetical protein NYA9BBAC_00955 [Salinibacterium sp. NYA9b]
MLSVLPVNARTADKDGVLVGRTGKKITLLHLQANH